MKRIVAIAAAGIVLCTGIGAARALFGDASPHSVLTGAAAFASYETEKPGVFRKITVADLPAPFATKSVANMARIVPRPRDAWPQTPARISRCRSMHLVSIMCRANCARRQMATFSSRKASPGEIMVLHGLTSDGKAESINVFASGLHRPFGIAFYPAGSESAIRLRRQHQFRGAISLSAMAM